MGQSNICVPDVLRTLLFSSITSNYLPVGTPFLHMLRMFRLVNATDGDMFFSVDGVNNNYFLPAGTFVLYDVTANKEVACNFYVPYGTQFYVKYSSAPSKNSVYIEGIYGVGE